MNTFILIMLAPLFLFSQIQIGEDIDGLNAGDNAGYSVSISNNGNIVAVGSPGYLNNKGHVRVFKITINETWEQIGETIYGEEIGDRFGSSISISGDGTTIAIGAPYNDQGGEDTGMVQVYKYNYGDWTQIGENFIGENPEYRSGLYVSLSNDGKILAISGFYCCGIFHGIPSAGKTSIYKNNIGQWNQIGEQITTGFGGIIDTEMSSDGFSIAIAGSGGGIGGMSNHYASAVEVYRYNSENWIQLGETFYGDFIYWGHDYISSATLNNNGTKLAIRYNDNFRVYEFGNNEWVQEGESVVIEYSFNRKLSMSGNGNFLAVGGSPTKIYKNISNNWFQKGGDILGENTNDKFGTGIEISNDGTTLIVGASNNYNNGQASGHARVYDLSELLFVFPNTQINTIIYPNPTQNEFNILLDKNEVLKQVEIFSDSGQLIKSFNKRNINTTLLKKGMYIIKIYTNKGVATEKLIIK